MTFISIRWYADCQDGLYPNQRLDVFFLFFFFFGGGVMGGVSI